MAKIELLKKAYKSGLSAKKTFGLALKLITAKNLGQIWGAIVAPSIPATKGVIVG